MWIGCGHPARAFSSTRRKQRVWRGGSPGWLAAALALFVLVFSTPLLADRTRLKPGWNLYSPQDDIDYGRQVSRDAERKLPMLNDRKVDDYLNSMGQGLAAKAPGERYPYQFRCVNDSALNAFALPGGFLYVNRGTIEAADNEAQLAGVMGHEIGHVALRHGTNQASKAAFTGGLLAIFGGVVGSGSLGALVAQYGATFAADSLMLRYSRSAEQQADLVGTQILYDNNYDPRAMAQFFEKIEAQGKSGRPPQWLSSHPNPENRIQSVNSEIDRMGGMPARYQANSPQFQEIKRYVKSLPPAPKPGQPTRGGSSGRSPSPGKPSEKSQAFQNNALRLSYPDNWRAYGQGDAVTLAPEGGVVDDGSGRSALAYGAIAALFEPHEDRHSRITLESATDQLIDQFRNANPRMRVSRDHERSRVGRESALATLLVNDSPLGGRESDWILTVLRAEGLYYIVCVAPENEFAAYSRTFRSILDSIRFLR